MTMARLKLRLGLLGTGVAAERLYLPAFEALRGRVEVVACCNRTRKKAEVYARRAKIPRVVDTAEELIADPEVDALLISLPIDVQPKYVLQCLRAGKPVLSEKPVAPSVAEGRRLVRAAKRFSAPWLVGENFAFMPQVSALAEWVSGGQLGELRLIEAVQINQMDAENPYFETAWRQQPQHVGGFVVDGGVHLAHVVRRCFGMPEVVRSLTAQFDPRLPPLDTAVATLRFASGALGTWISCFSARYDGPMLRVYGSRANAELRYGEASLLPHRGRPKRVTEKESSFTSELRHFADVVQKGAPVAVSPADALLDLELVARIIRP